MKITNNSDVPLALSVWAVNDQYDYVPDPNYFSVTTLLKPLRQIVLSRRVNLDEYTMDVENFLATAMGTSIHDSIEKAWVNNYKECLAKLGFNENIIERFRINPKPEDLTPNCIPVYLEHRTVKELDKYKIGGKFDLVADGLLHDNKSTTTMKWLKGSSDHDYMLQGSMYRWLNPDLITEDFIRINFVFTDWSKLAALKDPSYPQHRVAYKDIPLMSIEDTEDWIIKKLNLIERYMNADQDDIPNCTDEELWRTPTKYKFYLNPAAQRASKVFDSKVEAYKYQQLEKGGRGVIRIYPGEARRCNYCLASDICSQRKEMLYGS